MRRWPGWREVLGFCFAMFGAIGGKNIFGEFVWRWFDIIWIMDSASLGSWINKPNCGALPLFTRGLRQGLHPADGIGLWSSFRGDPRNSLETSHHDQCCMQTEQWGMFLSWTLKSSQFLVTQAGRFRTLKRTRIQTFCMIPSTLPWSRGRCTSFSWRYFSYAIEILSPQKNTKPWFIWHTWSILKKNNLYWTYFNTSSYLPKRYFRSSSE